MTLIRCLDERYRLAEFDTEAVLFDAVSGDTHYLAPAAYARLKGLSLDEILRTVDSEANARLMAEIDRQLRDWGLMA